MHLHKFFLSNKDIYEPRNHKFQRSGSLSNQMEILPQNIQALPPAYELLGSNHSYGFGLWLHEHLIPLLGSYIWAIYHLILRHLHWHIIIPPLPFWDCVELLKCKCDIEKEGALMKEREQVGNFWISYDSIYRTRKVSSYADWIYAGSINGVSPIWHSNMCLRSLQQTIIMIREQFTILAAW